MPKKLAKDILRFGAGSITLGVASVGAGAFTGSGVHAASGLSAVGSMMPATGSVMMMGHAVRMTGKLMPKKKKKRRY